MEKLTYEELRNEIHKIFCDFMEQTLIKSIETGEFDEQWLESKTDDILDLITRQGGTY